MVSHGDFRAANALRNHGIIVIVGGRGEKYGTIADVEKVGATPLVVVGGLRQGPDVVFRFEVGEIFPVLTGIDLVVERLGAVIPHCNEPVETEFSFGGEIG